MKEWVTTTQVLEQLKADANSPAWEHLHDHFRGAIVGFARNMGLGQADAEDAAQEAMLAFFKAYRDGKYQRERGRLSHWLFGVARRTILNYRKRQPRERQIVDDDNTSFWDRITDDKVAQETWSTYWRQMVLERCLAVVRRELAENTFEAFHRYAILGEPVEQVAGAMEMTANAVYIAKNRVLKRLRELEKDFDGS